MKTIKFELQGTNEFGWFTTERKAKTEAPEWDLETIFRDCLKSLPKRLNNWESLSFETSEEKVEVRKDWLEETDWDFSMSHEVELI